MKKTLLSAALAALVMASCGSNNENAAEQKTIQVPEGGQIVAYVEWDSLVSQYQFCKDYNEVMALEYENAQRTLASKQHDLQQHMATVQKKYENNGFTTRDELDRAQASVAREQQDLQELDARLTSQFAENQDNFAKEINDSLQNYIKVFNKTHKYSYILSKSGNNILFADTAYDVTADIVKGLNARYKAKPEIQEKLKKTEEK